MSPKDALRAVRLERGSLEIAKEVVRSGGGWESFVETCWRDFRYGLRVLRKSRTFTLIDRKSTRLNSSHGYISYAVFCLKKKKCDAVGSSRVTVLASGGSTLARAADGACSGVSARGRVASGAIYAHTWLESDAPPGGTR